MNENPLEERFKKNQSVRNLRWLMGFIAVIAVISVIAVAIVINMAAKELKRQNTILQQQGELITCLLAIHLGPDKFPSADQKKCQEKVASVNNADGSFLSREADGQGTPAVQGKTGVQGQRGTQGNRGPAGPPGNTGIIGGIANTVGGVVGGITNQLGKL